MFAYVFRGGSSKLIVTSKLLFKGKLSESRNKEGHAFFVKYFFPKQPGWQCLLKMKGYFLDAIKSTEREAAWTH